MASARSDPGIADFMALLACAAGAALLFCLRFALSQGGLMHGVMMAMFAVPAALAASIVFAYPVLLLMRRRHLRHPALYTAAPAAIVLLLAMAPMLVPGPTTHLSDGGHGLIENGRPVWSNLGWIAFYSGEPALWAALAGFAFWWSRVRAS